MKAILARSKNNVIGNQNSIPWRSKEDMRFFREKTEFQTLIMGRNTFESLPNGGLRNRRIIVLSTKEIGLILNSELNCNTEFVKNVDDALIKAKNVEIAGGECWVTGGELVYRQFVPYCDEVFVTEFEFEVDGDTFGPDLSAFQQKTEIQKIPNGIIYKYTK